MSDVQNISYADIVQMIWQRRLDFSELLEYTAQFDRRGQEGLVTVLYQTWLKRNPSPHDAVAWFNLGVNLFSGGDVDAAGEAYQQALQRSPRLLQARFNLGLVYEQKGQLEEAIAQWRQVEEQASADHPEERAVLIAALNHQSRVKETWNKQYGDALACHERSLALDPNQSDVLHHWVFVRAKQCLWPVQSPPPGVDHTLMQRSTSALAMLALSDDPATQLEAARQFLERKIPPDLPVLAPPEGYRHNKIRIGYCSSDFCCHPVSMLTVELFELHNREKFEVYGFCWSPDDGSPLRQRVVKAFDHYISIKSLNDEESARLIREHEIDVLIDLHGQTAGARINMLAYRPAPLQITYLGLPATTGMPTIDYVIADRYLIPEQYARYYSEKPLYLPDIYQSSDRKRLCVPAPTRKGCGLPAEGFVFCSFNNNYKYTPEMFTVWMNILRRVPGSILWLLSDNPWAEENLRREAAARGMEEGRIFFSQRALPEVYLSRYLLADLFLDTFPFNAGTTANDALWMGLPILTMSGRSFASRMAGALLTAAGLPQLITQNLQDYEDKAVELATVPGACLRFREHLEVVRQRGVLFDTPRLVANLERELIRLVTGAAPESENIINLINHAEQQKSVADLAGAIQTYRSWLEREPNAGDSWMAWFNLGILLRDSGDVGAARSAFVTALRQRPDFSQAQQVLAMLSDMPAMPMPQNRSTPGTVAKHEPTAPHHIANVIDVAELCKSQGDVAGAIQSYRNWLEREPNNGDSWMAWFNLGILMRDSGDVSKARQAFVNALHQRPDFPQAQQALVDLH